MALDVTSHPTASLGSISLLSFLTETSTLPVREDPLRLWYELKPEEPEEELQDLYEIKPASNEQLEISRRNSSALINQSLPLDFSTLAGAAAVYAPHSRLPRLVTVYRESAEEPRGISRIAASSPLCECVSRFWLELNPDGSLIREFTIQIPTDRAKELFDFHILERAISTGDLNSKSQSVENIAQRFPELKKEDAIADVSTLREYLDQWANVLSIDLWKHRERIRFRWNTNHNENIAIQLSALAEPFLTTLLHSIMSLNYTVEANDTDISWFYPGDYTLSDMVADYRGERRPVPEQWSGEFLENLCFFESISISDENPEELEYVEPVPLTPSVLPFVTQGLALSESSSANCNIDYDEGPYIQQILYGLAAWDAFETLSEIAIEYETRVKIGLGADTWRKNRRRGQEALEDEYIESYIPPWVDELSTQVQITEPQQAELLGLVEQYFDSVEDLVNRPDTDQTTLGETQNTRSSPKYKSDIQKKNKVYLTINDEIKTAAYRLWYDLFYPSSELQIPLRED